MSEDIAVVPVAASSSSDLPAVIDAPDSIVTRREPALVLAEARKAAAALTEVIAAKKHKVMFNGEQYIENEDWQTIARFYGLTAKIESDQFCEYGGAQGFEATAVVLDVNGTERSRATAMCLNDEANWSTRARYAFVYVLKDNTTQEDEPADVWKQCVLEPTGKLREDGSAVMRPKKIRKIVGEETVPLFQLRSMAQTRAASKAFAMVLRFVPVLAGMKATPAEELPGAEVVTTDTEVAIPQRTAPAQASTAAQDPAAKKATAEKTATGKTKVPGKKISEAQRKRLFAIANENGVSQSAIKTYCETRLHIESSADIAMDDYDALISWVRGGGDEPGSNG